MDITITRIKALFLDDTTLIMIVTFTKRYVRKVLNNLFCDRAAKKDNVTNQRFYRYVIYSRISCRREKRILSISWNLKNLV